MADLMKTLDYLEGEIRKNIAALERVRSITDGWKVCDIKSVAAHIIAHPLESKPPPVEVRTPTPPRCIEHVKDGKPLTEHGANLLGIPWQHGAPLLVDREKFTAVVRALITSPPTSKANISQRLRSR